MRIGGFQAFSLSDYPGKTAAIIFTQGCNFNCPFCHNQQLLPYYENEQFYNPQEPRDPQEPRHPRESEDPYSREPSGNIPNFIDNDELLNYLKKRKSQLDGIVITGGEPTIQSDLQSFITQLKSLHYLVKLDTNGSHPAVLQALIKEGLLDYIAMDVKAPFEKYHQLSGRSIDIKSIQQSIALIAQSNIPHEFRTTFYKEMLSDADLEKIKQYMPATSLFKVQVCRFHR